MKSQSSLRDYNKKRNFSKTSEPISNNSTQPSKKTPIFVIHEHWASHHHFDLRLEAFGNLKSWAVPKGPPLSVGEKRLAVEVEDHPLDYAKFQGTIPDGEYGAGRVKIWDKGLWVPPQNLKKNLIKGHLEFELQGKKLKGKWLLVRSKKTDKKNQWLMIKRHDQPKFSKIEDLHNKILQKKRNDPWPNNLKPQLATLKLHVPSGSDWIHEVKLDGYRTITHVRAKSIHLMTRNGHDWTEKYDSVAQELKKIKLKTAVLDGEIVAINKYKKSDFSVLQNVLKEGKTSDLQYHIFDLLYLNGCDLRNEPLEIRKQLLKTLLVKANSKKLIFSPHWRTQGEMLYKKACEENLEGIISKLRAGPYRTGRSEDWQKIKCTLRQEFIIGGYTAPSMGRIGFGALILGIFENKKFKYVGRVGTGFDDKTLRLLYKKLSALDTVRNPFTFATPKENNGLNWVKLKLVCEVKFRAWTANGHLRQASFVTLINNKKVKEISRSTATKGLSKLNKPDIFKITSPERIIYKKNKITKIDVANYYRSAAPWLLKLSAGRPLSLVRCPNGLGESCFFQKHFDTSKLHSVKAMLARAKNEKQQNANYIDSLAGLLELIQWGVLELHTWQSHSEHIRHPDQLVFDLDPGKGVMWSTVAETAFKLKDLLERLALKSFVKTTGGKGLHIHVPIAPIYEWSDTKEFSKTVARQLELENSGQYTTNISKKLRKNKIFIDYLRNGFGATSVAPYSLRNRSEAIVAVPLTWKELKILKSPDVFYKDKVMERLAQEKTNPWPRYSKLKQKIKILKV